MLGRIAAAGIAVIACSQSGDEIRDFRVTSTIATPVHPNDLELHDFDGDGDLDAAVAGFVQPTLQLYENRDGRLIPAARLEIAAGALDLLVADLDGDGLAELIATETGADRVGIYLPDLRDPVLLDAVAVTAPDSAAAGDFDGDGFVDLAVSRFAGDEVIYLSGASSFATRRRLQVPAGPTALQTLDLDGTGGLEFLVLSSRADRLTIWSSHPDGTFTLRRQLATCAFPAGVDTRGSLLVVACNLGNAVAVIDLSHEAAELLALPAGQGPLGVALGDIGQDGTIDLAITNKFEDTIGIRSLAAPEPAGWTAIEVHGGPTPLAIADLDSDGRLDLVTASGFEDRLDVLERAP